MPGLVIKKLVLRNFKGIEHLEIEFSEFDLLVGPNNSGKSTILQAMALWSFCVNAGKRARKSGTGGVQITLPEFSAVPLPEFVLLWHNRQERKAKPGGKIGATEPVPIVVGLEWSDGDDLHSATISIRYQSKTAVYASPVDKEWQELKGMSTPKILYVPTFSGLEPLEERRDDGPISLQVGKGQPGSVLRNLLLKVRLLDDDGVAWKALSDQVNMWFGLPLLAPKYDPATSTRIDCRFKKDQKSYDIISGGSGFHQVLTILGFYFGYSPTTILLDEPDAHLHVNLQRAIFEFFSELARNQKGQFIVATHAERLIESADSGQVVWLNTEEAPVRLSSSQEAISALELVSNRDILATTSKRLVLYVEGDSDEKLIRAWASVLGKDRLLDAVHFHQLGGGGHKVMQEGSDRHFRAIKVFRRHLRRLLLLDKDKSTLSSQGSLFVWKRQNIENYLLVKDAWLRASTVPGEGNLFNSLLGIIDLFFTQQGLNLPPGSDWRTLSAQSFQAVDGKGLLYTQVDSLTKGLWAELIAETSRTTAPTRWSFSQGDIARAMLPEEIHQDIIEFFDKVQEVLEEADGLDQDG